MMNHIQNKPERIFKYENTSIYSLLNLKSGVIYFNKPANFNDPFDCQFNSKIEVSDDELIEYVKNLEDKIPFSDNLKMDIKKLPNSALRIKFEEIANNVLIEAQRKLREDGGMACFSEVNNNLLMWAHYGSSYKGFCLEFDTQFEMFDKIRPVQYSSSTPKFKLSSLLNSTNSEVDKDEEVYKLWGTKSEYWAYEKEWRIPHKHFGTKYRYPQEALKAIYFGPMIDLQSREILCLLVQGQNRGVKFYEGRISNDEFKIQFVEFQYTPYIIAKEQGLIK